MSGNGFSILLLVLASAGGALIAAQGPIYTRMASGLGGPIQAAMLAFAIGTLSLFLISVLTRTPLPQISEMMQVPIWVWAGGLIGVYMVLVSIIAVPKLGVASFMVAVVVGQLAASHLYDHFGVFGLEPRQVSPLNVLGLILMMVGVFLTSWK